MTSFDPRDVARYLNMEMREFLWLCEDAGVSLKRLARDRYRNLLVPEVEAVIRTKRLRKNGGRWTEKRRLAQESSR